VDKLESTFDQGPFMEEHFDKYILLDTNSHVTSKFYGGSAVTKGSQFWLSLNDNRNPFFVRQRHISIPVGYRVEVKIIPSVTEASESLRAMHPEARKCRFLDETEGMFLFSNYTQVQK